MDIKRRTEKNRILNEIREITGYMNIDIATLNRLRAVPSTDYIIKQLAKLTEKNEERKERITNFNTRLEALNMGELDNELNEEYRIAQEDIKRKLDEKKRKKDIISADKAEKVVASKIYYEAERQEARKYKYDEKSAEYSLKHFHKVCDSIPDYILRNLVGMPNNKGYIWRGVHCYGELPPEKNKPCVMFENMRGGIKRSYETTNNEIRIYEKKGQGRRILISCEPRKRNDGAGQSLASYIK